MNPVLHIASTGAANLASVTAMCDRAGITAIITEDADLLYRAGRALLPGVGAFGAAMETLESTGMAKALAARISEGRPTMGICLGMQLFCASSEESPGIPGIGALPCPVGRFQGSLPLPQLGWNRIVPAEGDSFLSPGWAYFANSYRVKTAPEGFLPSSCVYGEDFCATLEAAFDPGTGIPAILLCQFHPELSGPWGLDLFRRWMGMTPNRAAAPGTRTAEAGAAIRSANKADKNWARRRGTAVRVIPCLDIKGGRVVKGVKFENLIDSGDPATLSARYEAEGADEIALLDISATIEERATALESVKAVRAKVSIPISVGGGIRKIEDAERLLNAGADRVSVNSAAVRTPELVTALAEKFGVQCVIVAIDARRLPEGDGGAPRWEVVIDAGRTGTGLDAVEWAKRCAALGAGEILLTSIDRDGTGLGYDEDLVAAIAKASGIPVIASGGATKREHFLGGLKANAGAVLAAGAFHRGELAIGDLKAWLDDEHMEVRR
jgi:cyclase